MRIFLSSNDFNVWKIILLVTWSEQEKKTHFINTKATNALYCALNEIKFDRVYFFITTKEIWDLLEDTHEGTYQVKEFKINLLTYKYEIFRVENKTINTMYVKFDDIVIGLKRLEKTIEKVELNYKVLLSLPKEWWPKVTAIEEAKDLPLWP